MGSQASPVVLLWAPLLCGFMMRLLLSFRPQLSSARGSFS